MALRITGNIDGHLILERRTYGERMANGQIARNLNSEADARAIIDFLSLRLPVTTFRQLADVIRRYNNGSLS